MDPSSSDPRRTLMPEWLRITLALSFLAVLLAACTQGPLVIAKKCGAGWGVAAAVLAFVPWRYCGPRPCPGFVAGTICVLGYAAIAATLLGSLIFFFRS